MRPLKNTKHERFAQLRASGLNQTQAYLQVYDVQHDTARNKAAQLVAIGCVAERIAELQAASATKNTLTAQERREFLAGVVRGPLSELVTMADKLRAVRLDAELAGELTKKHEVTMPQIDELLEGILGVNQPIPRLDKAAVARVVDAD